MHHIIVGFDGSGSSIAALAWAVDEARLHEARLTVHTVFARHRPLRDNHLVEEPGAAERLRRSAEEIADGFPFDFESERSDHSAVADKLTSAVAATDADLLV